MQILKEEVKCTLMLAALNEFNNKGFEKASMRAIAKASGMTIGNIYNYYPNKNALFSAIVSPAFNEYSKNIGSIKEKLCERKCSNIGKSLKYFDGVETSLLNLIKSFSSEMTLLFTGSEGSKYQYIKEELIQISYEVTKSIFANAFSSPINDSSYHDKLAFTIAKTLIESICIIMKDNSNDEFFEMLLDHIILTYSKSIKIAVNPKGENFNGK